MDPERVPYMRIHARAQGTRNRRQPRMPWIDMVKNGVEQKGLQMNKVIKLVQDRK